MAYNNIIKKVAAINDLSGSSRCSLTTAIPVLYAMGIQCCALPTAILSNHTGYESCFFDDYTKKMPEFTYNWQKQNLHFDAIYTGFLGSATQIDIVCDFIKKFKSDSTLLLVDPVMGDNGRLYSTYTRSMCMQMEKLVQKSDIVTPNITEACTLCGVDYDGEYITDDMVAHIAKKIKNMGAESVVITGVKSYDKTNDAHYISNVVFKEDTLKKYTCDMTGVNYSGTGDLFASVVCGKVLNGIDVFNAVSFATEYISMVGKYSQKIGLGVNDGVCFEKFIQNLTNEKIN